MKPTIFKDTANGITERIRCNIGYIKKAEGKIDNINSPQFRRQ